MRKIIQLGDPVLEQKSKLVELPLTKEENLLIDDMLEILNSNPENSAGISAPQVGILKRIAICRRMDLAEDNDKKPLWEVMINPEILLSSDNESIYWEGCLSIKNGDLFGEVSRPEDVRVKYTNRKGEVRELECSDYFSHIVQHEIDHLNGVLFISYIDDPENLYTGKELDSILNE